MKAVIGLGFGDEGKGLVTSYLCHQVLKEKSNPLVIRFNGGHQAGHTVYVEKDRHVFSSFGSGTLQGVPTYWSKHCTFYPPSFLKEYDILISKGYNPVIYVSNMSPVTTPYDVYANREHSSMIGGTVGMGFGYTLQRQEDHYTLFVKDLKYPEVVRAKLSNIRKYYEKKLNTILDIIDDSFIQDCIRASTVIKIVSKIEASFLASYTHIYEGAQGTLLDMDEGFFPDVTRSNTTIKNIYPTLSEVNLVMRSYLTRHGKGYFPDNGPISLVNNSEETNITNPWQGSLRITSHTFSLIDYAVDCNISKINRKNVRVNLFVTCCDQYTGEIDTIIEKLYDKYNFNNVYKSFGPNYKNIVKTIYDQKES